MTGGDADPELRDLADAYGIDTRYWDWQGHEQPVAAATLRAVLYAFDVDATSPESCRAALDAVQQARRERVLPPCVVRRAGRADPVPTAAGSTAAWLELEDAPGARELAISSAGEGCRVDLPADLPLGYHRLIVTAGGSRHAAPLIVVPDRLSWPAVLDEPAWGMAVQLYSVRSRRSWGLGDLGDLGELARWSAACGADFVLVNPLHASEVVAPINPSPYLPTSRRFGDPSYLRVEQIPEFGRLPIRVRAEVDASGRTVSTEAAVLDREASWAAKAAALARVHGVRLDAERRRGYETFCAREGAALERFACWCALSEVYGSDWHAWPAGLRDPDGPEVAAAARRLERRVDFHRWLQWQLHEQLADTQDAARGAGMRLGVLHDLAVGVSPAGADAWAFQDVLAAGVTVGAPPDAYAQTGQDWRQPPWRPDRLAQLGYAPLRDLFRAGLRHGGGLRVDHIIGLFRLWWIPAGGPAGAGTYVHYDEEALIGILALEADRAGAVVIGEDLGNVEPRVHGYLHERGILGTSILWFESDRSSGAPLPAPRWRADCLASVTTHDLPPTTGYLAGDHVRLRDRLGLLTRSVDDELAASRREQQAWVAQLRRTGLLPADGEPDELQLVLALHRFLTRTPARLRCLALTDAVGERRTQNQPGTTEEYPNWRVPLAGPDGRPVLLEDVRTSERVAAVVAAVARG